MTICSRQSCTDRSAIRSRREAQDLRSRCSTSIESRQRAPTTKLRAARRSEKFVREKGIIPAVQYRKSLVALEHLKFRVGIEEQRVAEFGRNISAQLAAEQARLDQLANTRELRQRQTDALKVRAGIAGVLQRVAVEEGQQVAAGSNLARVARPGELMAELRIAETQAKDIVIDQPARIDTRNGIVAGKVLRIDPAVQNGSVQVDVELVGELPAGARPDLSVDGTVEIERLADVLYVGRPAFGQADSEVRLFRVAADGVAARVPVRLGRSSVNLIEIRQGLDVGDRVVLSDTSAYEQNDRIRIK